MTDTTPKPPEGYATWLDYAVEAMPTRQLHLEQMFKDLDSDNEPITMRDDFRNAAVAELQALRDRAAKAVDEEEIRRDERNRAFNIAKNHEHPIGEKCDCPAVIAEAIVHNNEAEK